METKQFSYNELPIGFEINEKEVMVNATQMANKLVKAFCQKAN